MPLKLYYDLMSQPSRVLYIILKYAKYDFQQNYLDLRKGEHYSEEYTAVNRFQKVPVIDHDGFILTESVAILNYLSRVDIVPDSLYPKDNRQQARVQEFLEWHHLGLRLHCSMYFRVKHMNPILTGTKSEARLVQSYERRMTLALKEFDTKWLSRSQFVAGDKITAADLFAACELEQPRMAGFDPSENHPNIAAWWPKVRQHFNPYYAEAHVTLNKIVKNTMSKL